MTDIIVRVSDKRVQTVANSIATLSDRYVASSGPVTEQLPFASFGYPTTVINNITGVPSDLVGGYNYNYVGGSFVDSGTPVPVPPEPVVVEPAP